jgi:hypothetical protein
VTEDKVKVTTDNVKRAGSWHSYGIFPRAANPDKVSISPPSIKFKT